MKFSKNDIKFYPIIDNIALSKKLINAGVKFLQVRVKNNKDKVAEIVKELIQYDVKIIVNDWLDICKEYNCAGIHLGQDDLLKFKREDLDEKFILGISTHSFSEIDNALKYKPDYLAFGSIFPTTSKKIPPKPQGLEMLKKVRKYVKIPLVAIGGINEKNIADVYETGVDGISVIEMAKNPNIEQILSTIFQKTGDFLRK